MKELLTINANFLARIAEDQRPLPQVEVILVMSEPSYSVDGAGEVVRHRTTCSSRFLASPASLRKLSTALMKLADEAEAMFPACTEEEEEEDPGRLLRKSERAAHHAPAPGVPPT